MKGFLIGLLMGIAIAGPVSAATFYGNMAPNDTTPRIVAGAIDASGTPIRGRGFTSQQLGEGRYQIHFNNNSIRGCASLIANVTEGRGYPDGVGTSQVSCTRNFLVVVGNDVSGYRNVGFSFVAVEE